MKKNLQLILLIILCFYAFVAGAYTEHLAFAWLNTPIAETTKLPIIRNYFKLNENTTVSPSKFNETSTQFRTTLRDIFSVKLNHNMEIGLDSFKIRPLEAECQILRDASFQTSVQRPVDTNRGYGVEFRIKLP